MDNLQAISSATEPPIVRKLHTVGRAMGVPVAGTFELTSGCNFNCRMCYIHDGAPSRDELSADTWLDIGRQAVKAGTVFILLTGGEPLIRPDFKEIYTGLKNMGLMVSVNTNGSLLTGDIADLFRQNPPMRLNVSLYSDNGDGYDRLCGVNAFSRVVDNIRRMKEYGINVKLNVSFTDYNADRYRQIADLTEELGLHCQTSCYMYPPVRRDDNGQPFDRLSPSRAAEMFVKWQIAKGKRDKLLRSDEWISELKDDGCEDPGAPSEGVRCRAGNTAYWIDSKGNMIMCGMMPHESMNVVTCGFDSCWQKTREYMKTVRMPKKCSTCRLRPVCCVCPAACFAKTGGFDAPPEYLCRMSEAIAEELAKLKGVDYIET